MVFDWSNQTCDKLLSVIWWPDECGSLLVALVTEVESLQRAAALSSGSEHGKVESLSDELGTGPGQS